jgi:cobalt/nickel transport system ATP-binding protein
MNQQINENILELQDVSFRYPDGSFGLNQCSISIQRGSRSVLLGADGTGKTTPFLRGGALRHHPGCGKTGCYNS